MVGRHRPSCQGGRRALHGRDALARAARWARGSTRCGHGLGRTDSGPRQRSASWAEGEGQQRRDRRPWHLAGDTAACRQGRGDWGPHRACRLPRLHATAPLACTPALGLMPRRSTRVCHAPAGGPHRPVVCLMGVTDAPRRGRDGWVSRVDVSFWSGLGCCLGGCSSVALASNARGERGAAC
jgi:hypothetical protein